MAKVVAWDEDIAKLSIPELMRRVHPMKFSRENFVFARRIVETKREAFRDMWRHM
jgi:hypothetical protein